MNNTFERDYIIYCPRCGAEMKNTMRCCMKCGALNYDHPDNESMKKYSKDQKNVEKNVFIKTSLVSAPKEKMSDKNICLIVNIVLHVVFMLIYIFLFNKSMGVFGAFFLSLLIFGIMFVYNYAMQLIFIKANKKWWSYFIPLYNYYIYYEITLNNGLFSLLTFVPIVGIVVSIISSYKLGVKFGRSGWFTLFLPFVAIPIIAYSDDGLSLNSLSLHKEDEKQDLTKKTKSEIDYGRKRLFIFIIVLTIIIFVLYFLYPYIIRLYDYFDQLISKLIYN